MKGKKIEFIASWDEMNAASGKTISLSRKILAWFAANPGVPGWPSGSDISSLPDIAEGKKSEVKSGKEGKNGMPTTTMLRFYSQDELPANVEGLEVGGRSTLVIALDYTLLYLSYFNILKWVNRSVMCL
eukprot:1195169-Prorocentrum_minimum.AAC.2